MATFELRIHQRVLLMGLRFICTITLIVESEMTRFSGRF